MEPHQQRVVDELQALVVKREALSAFIDGPVFRCLPPEDADLLYCQVDVMQDYAEVLSLRISRF